MRKHLIGAAGLAGVTALLVGCTSAPAQSATTEAAPAPEQIKALFADWNNALATGDAQKVADRYAPNAVLLPTVSNQVRSTRAEIVDYFEHFLLNKPSGEILDSHVAVLDTDDAIDAGTYRFSLTKDGKPTTVDARYTFVYEKIGGKWLIVNHHSSAMPEQA
ncbi:SgcJ/EcaC family oxidoreductase [Lentzea sp. BCCO 10_0061]|uniref:SgcJ/EcaC family oxidoreductase n=1 Tax=Lentzea sokolovensis TaxID=3095429 RepID=A0ABU4UNT7_9PSEU|nr:SgcJ/EcaC family oxidoreductase [Lentzea sp. BCCO 10_0061]MDX8141161.1 SgcJ/EcaC family oxidoreductase [Lentzea sp. BCCO 10_0061]